MTSPNSDHPQVTTRQRTVLLATDRSQSIIAEVTDGKHNNIAYCVYGEQSAHQPIATALGFNGHLRERSLGWYFLGNGYRAYNPVLMRFHSPDGWSPFGRGGLNGYMYCVGDPVNRVDPTGHVPWFHPRLTRYAKNTFNFFFGGAERTGARKATSVQARAVVSLGGLKLEKTGEGRALATVGAAVAGGAPAPKPQGLYPGGDLHPSARWGADTHFAGPSHPVGPPAQNAFSSGERVSFNPSAKLLDGPRPYIPRKEQNYLQGGEVLPRKDYWKSDSSLSTTGSTWSNASSNNTAGSSISSGRLSQASSDIRGLEDMRWRLDQLERDGNM